jgi:anion-transporting  ArsA/GET3 family ATPase
MTSPLQKGLIVVTGKGGTGKTTIATAIGLLGASRGLRTIVVEVGHQDRLSELLEHAAANPGREIQLEHDLWTLSIDPDQALLEWLQALGGRISGRILATSGTFQYFAAAAPGAKELVSMVKVWELAESKRRRGPAAGYDLVVLDAPATGHALGMLESPRTFNAIARVGTVATQTERVRALFADPARTGYIGVASASEMAVTETIELQQGLKRRVGRDLDAVVVNAVLPRRFNEPELAAVEQLDHPLARSAARAARSVHERARYQRNQIARLRRRRFAVLRVPFQFRAELDLESIRRIAEQLGRTL